MGPLSSCVGGRHDTFWKSTAESVGVGESNRLRIFRFTGLLERLICCQPLTPLARSGLLLCSRAALRVHNEHPKPQFSTSSPLTSSTSTTA